ncbi:MAG: glutamate--tRNA ligase family protein [Flavobacteriales bacterium]
MAVEWRNALSNVPRGGRTRIAPTPSGFLHAGNAVDILIIQALAAHFGATVLLRLDDLDEARVRPAYVEDVFRSLEWLGVRWDEGPSGPTDHAAHWKQRYRSGRYTELLAALQAKGVLYGCACSRREVRERSPDGVYTGTCRHLGLPLDDRHSWRMRLDGDGLVEVPGLISGSRMIDLHGVMGDPVVRQRGMDGAVGLPAYQVASLADDIDRAIDLIVRGEDLLASSACQRHLADVLGPGRFHAARFVHHPLLLDGSGGKLSKSAGALSLQAMRKAGATPDALRREADSMLNMLFRT